MVPVFTVLTEPVRVLCQQGSPWDRLIEALDWTLEHLGLDGHGDEQRRHRRLDALMGNIIRRDNRGPFQLISPSSSSVPWLAW